MGGSRRPDVDWSLYLVTDTGLCAATGVEGTVAAAVRCGVSVVQLRDPVSADREFVALGSRLVALLEGTGVPLIVNDRAHLVGEIGATGLHIGQGDLDVPAARALIGPQALLGLSVQNLDQLAAAVGHGSAIDYLGVGPVWPQTTKPDAAAPGGTGALAVIAAASPWPCVAIGGVDATRAAEVRDCGAAGMAVVSAICGKADPGAAAAGLRSAWDKAVQS